MTHDLVMRSDAKKNRERILEVAVVELTSDPAIPLSTIAKKAGVGQGTFYRHFPTREKLVFEVYQFEMQQVAALAEELLATKQPKEALREWMDCLAEYAMTKAGLAAAIQQAASVYEFPGKSGYAPVQGAAELLLRANEKAGTIRSGITNDDFFLAIAGIWQMDAQSEWRLRLARLMNLVMDGLCAGSPENLKKNNA
ncbi:MULTISPECIES: TetR/AcrR family transcriptional regulator [unclassified Pseudomonas]|uniref:TetR/AcrR family transcriptional regulator n=1 Tax=unclassified Pseudomonas TaxID=196821 RepID=UPI002A370B2E|nr:MULTISPECIES: TetR/AcrR family transcriptional regulator [unclassified Pseudomonas]MDX9669002.1 TetR/AcrR family transcriptional regulator [Pseudomonas sp. P8_250]WPN36947.1 TetR/AcrR family transcriptional regulator [Pseudomonas sp. P8_139]WPN41252.1 TetR/AcrR family transcriptional regulator [Pseudomonas sp. P8_229]